MSFGKKPGIGFFVCVGGCQRYKDLYKQVAGWFSVFKFTIKPKTDYRAFASVYHKYVVTIQKLKDIMKIEIDDNSLIDEIVKRVVGQLKPMLNSSHNSVDDELMDVKGLAKYLKVKESWVYEKIHTRQIPFQKAGRFPRFRKKNIDKWLENPYSSLHVPIGRSKRKEDMSNE